MSHHGKHHKRRRGTHKRAGSPEVVRYLAEQAPPVRPVWLDRDTYRELMALRQSLELEGVRP